MGSTWSLTDYIFALTNEIIILCSKGTFSSPTYGPVRYKNVPHRTVTRLTRAAANVLTIYSFNLKFKKFAKICKKSITILK